MRSVLINTHLLEESRQGGSPALPVHFLSLRLSAGCRVRTGWTAGGDAYPADREDGYGWEKLFTRADVPPLHRGLWAGDSGGAAPQRLRPARHLERRPGEGAGGALPQGGRGGQGREGTRSRSGATASRPARFMYIADCLEGLGRIMDGEYSEPVNLGSSELVTITQLAARGRARSPGSSCTTRYDRERPAGRQGAQLREHPDHGALRVGAVDAARSRVWWTPTTGWPSRSEAADGRCRLGEAG